MNDAITAAVAAAMAQSQKAVPAVIDQPGAQVATAAPLVGRARSLQESVDATGAVSDLYLQVDKTGIIIDKEFKTPFETLAVTLRLADFLTIYSIRYNAAGNTQYGRSVDGIRETKTGLPWSHFCDKAATLDPKATQYDAYEFVATLAADVTTKKGVIKAGTRLGHTTSKTNFKEFSSWIKTVIKTATEDQVLNVILSQKTIDDGKNVWGVIVPSLAN